MTSRAMTALRRRLRSAATDAGFSLLEVMVAFTVFTILCGTATVAIVQSLDAAHGSQQRIDAANVAQSFIASTQAAAQSAANGTSTFTASVKQSEDFTVRRTIAFTAGATTCSPISGQPPPDRETETGFRQPGAGRACQPGVPSPHESWRLTMYDKLRKIREERAAEDRGFTLIELLVVVVIIGILVAIAIPLYLSYQKGAHDRSAQSDLRNAVPALQQCFSENGNAYPVPATAMNDVASGDAALALTCGTDTETIKLSAQSHLKYAPAALGASYELWVWNTGGKKHTDLASAYHYDSAAGGNVGP